MNLWREIYKKNSTFAFLLGHSVLCAFTLCFSPFACSSFMSRALFSIPRNFHAATVCVVLIVGAPVDVMKLQCRLIAIHLT